MTTRPRPRTALPFAALAALAALAGCAAPTGQVVVAEGSAALQRTAVCCQHLSQAARRPLPREMIDLTVDAKTAQAFDFGGSKAFFLLFELPAYDRPYSVVITSLAQGPIQDVAIFIPRVAFYDASFEVTRFFDEKTLRNRGNNVERTVFVNPHNAGDRYLAVWGSDLSSSIERAYSMVTVTPIVAGPVMFNLYGGVDGKSVLRSAPTGMVRIEPQFAAPPAAAAPTR